MGGSSIIYVHIFLPSFFHLALMLRISFSPLFIAPSTKRQELQNSFKKRINSPFLSIQERNMAFLLFSHYKREAEEAQASCRVKRILGSLALLNGLLLPLFFVCSDTFLSLLPLLLHPHSFLPRWHKPGIVHPFFLREFGFQFIQALVSDPDYEQAGGSSCRSFGKTDA